MNRLKHIAITVSVLAVLFVFGSSAGVFPRGISPAILLVSPLLGRVTYDSATLNLVGAEEPAVGQVRFRKDGSAVAEPWQETAPFAIDPKAAAPVKLHPLVADSLYRYELFARLKNETEFSQVAGGIFRTQRSKPSAFSFALISDSHITPWHKSRLAVLNQVSGAVVDRKPELVLLLGDNIQTFTSHGGPIAEPEHGPLLYLSLRKGLGNLPASVPVFLALGNWEGENGWHPERLRSWARQARKEYGCNPEPTTYPQGGSAAQDYYGFTWGDALFLVLNVTGYTPKDHSLGSPIGSRDDWTLGDEQKAWLKRQLAESETRWKLLFIHHPVGGNGGDDLNSRYGRGGGRAARVGEQALIHSWMRQYGVQALFYGHDHVFTDSVVDGIHYTCVGSAGAPWKFGTAETGYDKFWTPSGFTWVEVDSESLRVSFVRPDPLVAGGVIVHSYEIASPG